MKDILTHSRMSAFKQCNRKHYLQYELGLRKDREATPLRMGSAWHAAIDLLKQGHDLTAACDAVRANYSEIPAWATMDEWMLEAEIVLRMVTGWHWRWSEHRIEVIATEQVFDLPLLNPETGRPSQTWRLGGKIDGIIRLEDGRLAVMEHKTTGDQLDPESTYWRRLRLDQQISMYYHAARRLGYDVQTVLYDVARKPSIAPKKLTKAEQSATGLERESVEMFGERFSADIAERPDFYFARREIPRLDSDLDEFQHELWQIGQSMADARRLGRAYRNTSACVSFGQCPYLSVCDLKIDATSDAPSGFIFVPDVNPELATAE